MAWCLVKHRDFTFTLSDYPNLIQLSFQLYYYYYYLLPLLLLCGGLTNHLTQANFTLKIF